MVARWVVGHVSWSWCPAFRDCFIISPLRMEAYVLFRTLDTNSTFDTADCIRELHCMQSLLEPQVMFVALMFRWILNGRWTSTVSGCRWHMAMCEAKWIYSRVTSMMCILDQNVSIWCVTCDLVCHTHSEYVVKWKVTQSGVRGHYRESPQQIMIHFVSFGHPGSLTSFPSGLWSSYK